MNSEKEIDFISSYKFTCDKSSNNYDELYSLGRIYAKLMSDSGKDEEYEKCKETVGNYRRTNTELYLHIRDGFEDEILHGSRD